MRRDVVSVSRKPRGIETPAFWTKSILNVASSGAFLSTQSRISMGALFGTTLPGAEAVVRGD